MALTLESFCIICQETLIHQLIDLVLLQAHADEYQLLPPVTPPRRWIRLRERIIRHHPSSLSPPPNLWLSQSLFALSIYLIAISLCACVCVCVCVCVYPSINLSFSPLSIPFSLLSTQTPFPKHSDLSGEVVKEAHHLLAVNLAAVRPQVQSRCRPPQPYGETERLREGD
jgi:hypothetical protein